MIAENKTDSRATLYGRGRTAITVRLFLFLYLHPFDTARGSDGLGRLRARRRIGYSGEQNGQSVLPLAAQGTVCCRTRPHSSGRGSTRSPAPRFPTPNRDYLRFRTLDGSERRA